MLKKVLSERDRSSVFQVPADLLDNPSAINERVAAVPKEIQSALKLVLSYLFETEGPTNLRNPAYWIAEPYLAEYEVILARYLKSRTNGGGRKRYGKAGLMAMRKAQYRCEVCSEADVRLLVLDHANGRDDVSSFFVLCANCHQLKSRLFDWTGKPRAKGALEILSPVEKATE